jgi:CubicO group peptidase (beta-lactamase class C family)
MAADAIFQTMSMTKPVISAAIMMLYEQGELGLDDPVSKYLPSLADIQVIDTFNEADSSYTVRPAKTAVTIRHLLTQTSGFGYGFCNSTLRSLEQTTGLTPKELPLLHEPGSRWAYGMGTRILGEVVVALSGMTLEEFFRSKIFGPFGDERHFIRSLSGESTPPRYLTPAGERTPNGAATGDRPSTSGRR